MTPNTTELAPLMLVSQDVKVSFNQVSGFPTTKTIKKPVMIQDSTGMIKTGIRPSNFSGNFTKAFLTPKTE